MAEEVKETKSQGDTNLMAALSYIWILSVVMLLVKKDDPFVVFHAKQGVVIFVASIIFMFIPVVGWMLNLVVLAAEVAGFIKAYSGEKFRLPVIGDLAEKINI